MFRGCRSRFDGFSIAGLTHLYRKRSLPRRQAPFALSALFLLFLQYPMKKLLQVLLGELILGC